jgi:hypothetical protein
LLGRSQRLRSIEAHALVDGGGQRGNAGLVVLQGLLQFQQCVVGRVGTTENLGTQVIEQRDDLGGEKVVVVAARGRSSMTNRRESPALSSLIAATSVDLSVVESDERLPNLGPRPS